MSFRSPAFFQFLAAIDSHLASRTRMQGCSFCGGVLHSACYPHKPRGGSVELETTAPTMRQSFCCDKCRRRTTPESVLFLGRRVYPGFIMVLLSGMQSGVTDTLINELQLHLGGGASNIATVAALVARDIRGNPILEFRQRPFYAANRACRVANELAGSFQREGCPIAVGAVPAISVTTFKTWRDHAE